MQLFAGVWLAFVPALFIAQASAIEANANPMEKVIQLLDVLSKAIEKEGKEDAETYKAYTKFYQKETETNSKVIKSNGDKTSRLASDLKEAEAFREGKNKELIDTANKLSKNDAELTAGRDGRKKERALFEKNEATFVESLDQLQRAVATLNKKAPAASAASASLLSVAQHLKNTLMHGADFTLSTSQRETLDGFLRSAATENAPSFLQVASHGPYGEYKSNGGGVITTLESLSGSVTKEKEAGIAAENKQKTQFKAFETGLTTSLENDKKSMGDIKNSIAQSQEQSSQNKATLMEAQEIFKAATGHMDKVEGEFRQKTQAYKIRLGKRTDEAIAVHEAIRILGSNVAKTYIKDQSIGTVGKKKAASFIQLQQRSTVHRGRASADPFKKVKNMLKGMLQKLQDKQAQESKHAAWCDKEMGKTTISKKRKEGDVQKMKDRLDALGAELTQTKADLEAGTQDLKDIKGAMASALAIRVKEKTTATHAIKQYKSAAKLLASALKVLKGYYKNKAGGGREVDKKEFKDRQGAGSGIIGILEIAVDDFNKLYADTKEAEDAAVKDFKEMNEDNTVRSAVFEKDLEWKGRTKVKLEFDQTTMTNDLKSYEKELVAIDTYLEKLKSSCIIKAPSYAEKKAKRDAELASLKEGLAALRNQPR